MRLIMSTVSGPSPESVTPNVYSDAKAIVDTGKKIGVEHVAKEALKTGTTGLIPVKLSEKEIVYYTPAALDLIKQEFKETAQLCKSSLQSILSIGATSSSSEAILFAAKSVEKVLTLVHSLPSEYRSELNSLAEQAQQKIYQKVASDLDHSRTTEDLEEVAAESPVTKEVIADLEADQRVYENAYEEAQYTLAALEDTHAPFLEQRKHTLTMMAINDTIVVFKSVIANFKKVLEEDRKTPFTVQVDRSSLPTVRSSIARFEAETKTSPSPLTAKSQTESQKSSSSTESSSAATIHTPEEELPEPPE